MWATRILKSRVELDHYCIVIIATVGVYLKDENIGNHGYIGISILRIYRGYIGGYSGKFFF